MVCPVWCNGKKSCAGQFTAVSIPWLAFKSKICEKVPGSLSSRRCGLSRSGCRGKTAGNHSWVLHKDVEELAVQHQVVWQRVSSVTCVKWHHSHNNAALVTEHVGCEQCASVCCAVTGAYPGSSGGVIRSLPTKWCFRVMRDNKRLVCGKTSKNSTLVSPVIDSSMQRNQKDCTEFVDYFVNYLIIPTLYTSVSLFQSAVCVCVRACRSSGFGDAARTRPVRELLSNMDWSQMPSHWLGVTHLPPDL